MRRLVLGALLLTFVLIFSGAAQADLDDGLVAYYPFNGNANDESGNGHDGTVYGATLTKDRFGNEYSAYSFDGSSNYIEMISSESLNPGADSFSYSLWFKTTNSSLGYMVGRYDHVSDSDPEVCQNNTTWGVQFSSSQQLLGYFRDENKSDSCDGVNIEHHSLSNGDFHFLAAVRDKGTNKIRYYIDSVLIVETDDFSDSIIVDDNLKVGTHGNWGGYFNGVIDDIHIYNRALSETEIQELYSGSGMTDDECSDDDSYQKGFDDAIQKCKNDPESCGIHISGGDGDVAVYERGTLDIPYIDAGILGCYEDALITIGVILGYEKVECR